MIKAQKWRCRHCGSLVIKNYDHVAEGVGTFSHSHVKTCPKGFSDLTFADVLLESRRG